MIVIIVISDKLVVVVRLCLKHNQSCNLNRTDSKVASHLLDNKDYCDNNN